MDVAIVIMVIVLMIGGLATAIIKGTSKDLTVMKPILSFDEVNKLGILHNQYVAVIDGDEYMVGLYRQSYGEYVLDTEFGTADLVPVMSALMGLVDASVEVGG